MSRKLLVNIHLYLAAFFAPLVIVTAISGGGYLLGYKGSVTTETVASFPADVMNREAKDLKTEVSNVLKKADIDFDFEYIKDKGDELHTRPTSRKHYVIKLQSEQITVIHQIPNLQKRIVELHKGHGPTLFKNFQKVFALALIFIIVSGLLLGLKSPTLKNNILITTGIGCLVFFGLVLI
jgi:hypothetical protein